MDTDAENKPGTEGTLPGRVVTVNQVVAWNLAHYRQAAGWTQRQLAAALGWSEGKVSDAERSWHSGKTREFNAQELAVIAVALGIPVMALLLPPAADGRDETLSITLPGGRAIGMAGYMAAAVAPDPASAAPASDAYRRAYASAVRRYLPPELHELGERWVSRMDSPSAVAEAVARTRRMQGDAARLAEELGQMVAGMEKGTPP